MYLYFYNILDFCFYGTFEPLFQSTFMIFTLNIVHISFFRRQVHISLSYLLPLKVLSILGILPFESPALYIVLSFLDTCFELLLVDNIVQFPPGSRSWVCYGHQLTRRENLILLRPHIYFLYTFSKCSTGVVPVDYGPASLGAQGAQTRHGAACLLPGLPCWTIDKSNPNVF